MKIKFRAITTDVRGLDKRTQARTFRALAKANKSFSRDFHKVTDRFTHPNSPRFHSDIRYGPPPTAPKRGPDIPPPAGVEMTGRSRGNAIYAITWTENDPIFFYLEAGADRHRAVLPDYRSLTKARMGIRTFNKQGHIGKLYAFPISYIEPRWFAADVVRRYQGKFIAEVKSIYGRDATLNFFGRTRTS